MAAKKKLSYDELVELVEGMAYRMTQLDVVAFLIGYNGRVDEKDFENILKMYGAGIID